ncbi:MAG: recombinase family protein [Candidatus Sulfotelmatobacter sp.]|jgi:site-specific DNA recombinase
MNGIIYCRVSSKEQVEGTSLESQEAACRDYARRNGIEVAKVFIERGESAKFADRTQLLELLEFCRNRENAVQALLVWKIDRLARNVGDHFNIKANLLKQNVRVVSVTEPIDANPEGKLLETILAGFAQFDNDLRATRTVQGMRKKIQDGIFPWKPPLGYKTPTQAGTKKTGPDQPDQPLFGLLQRVWHDFATGSYTKTEILRIATSRGVRTRAGLPLTKQSLDNMLKDAFYAGIIKDPWSGEETAGRHLPLVSPDVFARVQQVISRRSNAHRHASVRPEFPLRMFARCSRCNQYVTGGFSRGRSLYYPYYSCFHRTCPHAMYERTEEVHKEFSGFLQSITPRPEDVERLAEYIVSAAKDRSRAASELANRRQRESQRLVEQKEQLIRMRMEQMITDGEFLAQRAMLSSREREVESSPMHGVVNEEQSRANLGIISEPLGNLENTWKSLPPLLQKRFQQSILPAGFVVGRIRTADITCLFSFLGRSKRTKSHVVPLTGQFWNQLEKEISIFSGIVCSEPTHSAA